MDLIRPVKKLNLSASKPFGLRRIFTYTINRATETSMSWLQYLPKGRNSMTIVQVEFVYVLNNFMEDYAIECFLSDTANQSTVIKDLIRAGRSKLKEKLALEGGN